MNNVTLLGIDLAKDVHVRCRLFACVSPDSDKLLKTLRRYKNFDKASFYQNNAIGQCNTRTWLNALKRAVIEILGGMI